jgi:molecular chaperone DnaK
MGTNYRVRIEGKEYTPQEISAMILQKLKQDSEDYFGEEITQAVITVPAYFTDSQRQATKDAGEIAGFNVRRIIDEPTAAALAYGLDKREDQTILVYDLGGGTFDVSIIEVVSGVFQVLAIHGNTHLGGDDFDKRIIEWLTEEFKNSTGVDLSDDPIAQQRLRDAAEEAKIELSEVKETQIVIEAITMSDKGPLNLDVGLSRAKFEELIEDLVKMTIPVQNTVRQFINRQPHRDIVPEEVVSLGAAVQTLVLAPIESDIEETLATRYGKEKPVIIHTTPFSLGVGLLNDQFGVIIERNSTYPTEAKDIFTTTRDFQEAISFPIYEGEENVASDNTFLDMLRIEGITPAPRGVPRIEVTFRLTQDRILDVRGEDLATGVEKKITIESTGTKLNEAEKQRMIKDAKERVTRMLRQRISDSVLDEADNLLRRADQALGSASGRQADELQRQITDARSLIEAGDTEGLEDLMDEINRQVTDMEAAG